MASNRMPTDGESWMRSVEQRLRILDRHNHPNAGAPGGAWTPLTLANSWANFGAGTVPAAYRVIGDTVDLRGVIKSGTTGTPVATLPIHPALIEIFSVQADSGGARVDVNEMGQIIVWSYFSGGTNARVSLSGIRVSITA